MRPRFFEVRLAVQSLDERLGECAVAPFGVCQRDLLAGRGGEHHRPLLGAGQVIKSIEVVVNNGGILRARIFHNMSIEDWQLTTKSQAKKPRARE